MKIRLNTNTRAVIRDFQRRLHKWYAAERRSLPWREETSLYRTVVSEFMCQQTQISTVIPYFERWMTSYPDFKALAAASEESILKHWEGLGYYQRARQLHSVAKSMNETHPPRTADAWAKFPGIGPYTAAAIASIACGRAVACVDGNVVRILSRMVGEEIVFKSGTDAARHFTPLANALMDDDNPGTHNQAMMELGATVCLRKKPLCTTCPVRTHCRAGSEGFAENLPRIKRVKTVSQTVHRVWIVKRGKLLMHRRPEKSSRMALLHELPTMEQVGANPESLGNGRTLIRKRSITRYRITEIIHFPTSLTTAQRA
jgi:A/G-specific adenine glycosylase